MAELTWENIAYDIEDALEELKRLNDSISSGSRPDEVEFRIAMQHIYHHLNFAWNTRYESIQGENFHKIWNYCDKKNVGNYG